jgi:hypothetical protein
MGFEAAGAAAADWFGGAAATDAVAAAGADAFTGVGVGALDTAAGAGAGGLLSGGVTAAELGGGAAALGAGGTALASGTASGPFTGVGTGALDTAVPSGGSYLSGGAGGIGDVATAAPTNFLPVTGSPGGFGGMAPLTGDVASQLGISSGDLTPTPPVSSPMVPDTPLGPTGVVNPAGVGGAPDGSGEWISKNQLQAGLLGMSVYNGTRQPKLSSAAQTALGASSAAVQDAQGIIQSGGTSSPLWATQKASIDQQVNTNLQNAIAQMVQSAQNSGMGGRDSGVVQQQINKLTTDAETQRQALYNQVLSQIVSTAVTELNGGNQTLGSIAQMQMSQSEQARAAASQTAELALLLGRGG